MRFSVMTVLITVRLIWGRLLNPVFIHKDFLKFFPVPKKSIYKKSLADYFFSN